MGGAKFCATKVQFQPKIISYSAKTSTLYALLVFVFLKFSLETDYSLQETLLVFPAHQRLAIGNENDIPTVTLHMVQVDNGRVMHPHEAPRKLSLYIRDVGGDYDIVSVGEAEHSIRPSCLNGHVVDNFFV